MTKLYRRKIKHQPDPTNDLTPPRTPTISPSAPSILPPEEIQKKEGRRRKCYGYRGNRTPALSLFLDNQALGKIAYNNKELFKASQSNILHHSTMRVDLFFYTLIAYYNTNLFVTPNKTAYQYGKGRDVNNTTKNITQACHSSFFGSFKDNNIIVNDKDDNQLLAYTHLFKCLNSTVELPPFANQFDSLLEEALGCRQKLLAIINNVSQGKYDPIHGLACFFKTMQIAFTEFEKWIKTNFKKTTWRFFANLPQEVRNDFFNLVESATFKDKWDHVSQTVEPQYINLLLRLKPEEKQAILENKDKQNEYYAQKFVELQKEILQNKYTAEMPSNQEEKPVRRASTLSM